MTSLAPSSDEEIAERIDASVSSYTTESNEDTFKPDTIFESFHHQAQIPISNRALLAGFLMLWLKRCVVLCRIVLPDSSAMTNYMLATLTLSLPSVEICLKVLGLGITAWLGGHKLFSAYLIRRQTATQALTSAPGTFRLARCMAIQ